MAIFATVPLNGVHIKIRIAANIIPSIKPHLRFGSIFSTSPDNAPNINPKIKTFNTAKIIFQVLLPDITCSFIDFFPPM